MKKTLVLLSILKQKARQFKKELSLSQAQALDEAARYFGHSNYKNYLNCLRAKRRHKEALLNDISIEKDMTKKSALVISFIQNIKIPFHEQLEIFKLLQDSEEYPQAVYEKLNLNSGLHDLVDQPWLQFVCEQLNFMKPEIQSHLLDDFLAGEGKDDIESFHPHFIAHEIAISDLMYDIRDDMLFVFDADYKLKLKLDFENFVFEDKELSKDQRFNDREMSGSFGVTIDRNKKISFLHSDMSYDY